MNNTEKDLIENVHHAVKEYFQFKHGKKAQYQVNDRIPYAGRIFDIEEMLNLIDASLEFWLTSGKYTRDFEAALARFIGVRYCSFVNSGSSANLLAFMCLTSPQLGERAIQRGDEVITVAAGFPTTVAPIIQYGAIPVFVDISIPSYNIDCNQLEAALSPKTKAIMIAHTLGNPFNLAKVKQFCDRHSLWLIEDNCDALGAQYKMDGVYRQTGAVGDIGTSSFYPPHHITTGEGGAVYTNNPELHRLIRSYRDWGRDCWCESGCDNSCGCRFERQYGELPKGYDHKYVYSHFGYNLKATDLQAAIGCAQIKKLPDFVLARNKNWHYLRQNLLTLEKHFILPESEEDAQPSWFGFVLTIREEAPFTREGLVTYLEAKNIQTRMLFAGNLIKHPCFDAYRQQKDFYRVIGSLINTEAVLHRTLWVGVYPGLSQLMLDQIIDTIKEYVEQYD